MQISVSSKWFPEHVEVPKLHHVRPFRGERRACRKRGTIPPSIWAERHRRLPDDSAMPGPWRNDTSPYATGILDAAYFPGVQHVSICAAPQVGKTEIVNTLLGYAIDRDAGPAMIVYPDQKTATHNLKQRVAPMIDSSPRLASYRTGREDDISGSQLLLSHMKIYTAWANSPSSLANKFIKHLVFDEVDKYPSLASKREAGPISLGEKRTRTFSWSCKIYKISSPTVESGPIWVALMESEVVFQFFVRCPRCGGMQLMETKNIRFFDHRDPSEIESRSLARYECAHCAAHWNDHDRDRAVAGGKWVDPVTGGELFAVLRERKPKKIGFRIPAWLSRFVSLSEVASAFLRSKDDKEKLRDFANGYEALPWVEYHTERPVDRILALRDERPEGAVPGGGVVAGVTAAVDTQDDGFWFEIRAWAYGRERESWQLRHGFLPTLDAVREVLFEEPLTDAAGIEYPVELALIDSGGHRTSEVYDWARLLRGRVLAFKGDTRMQRPIDFSNLEYYPTRKGTKRAIPGGLRLLRANSNFFKSRLSSQLEIAGGDPGAWHFHSETTEDWCRQLTVEYVDENGNWQCPPSKANHGWDCSYMNLVAAAIRRIEFRKPGGAKPKVQAAAPKQSVNPFTGEVEND